MKNNSVSVRHGCWFNVGMLLQTGCTLLLSTVSDMKQTLLDKQTVFSSGAAVLLQVPKENCCMKPQPTVKLKRLSSWI